MCNKQLYGPIKYDVTYNNCCQISIPPFWISSTAFISYRKEFKKSKLYHLSKAFWPISKLETTFLPEFPVNLKAHKDNYTAISEIARGSYGKVDKVVANRPQAVYALKTLSKRQVQFPLPQLYFDEKCNFVLILDHWGGPD